MSLRLFSFLLLTFFHPLIAGETTGRVELPLSLWQETQSRLAALEQAQKSPPPGTETPPVAKVVNLVRCEISAGNDIFLLTTDFEIDTLTNDWLTIPLIASALPLISVVADHGKIITVDNSYAWVGNFRGTIKIRMIQELPFVGGMSRFWIAAANVLAFRLAEETTAWNLTVNQRPLTSEAVSLAAVSSVNDERMTLEIARTPGKDHVQEEQKSLEPGKWESRAETQVTWQDGRLRYRSRVVLLCTEGNTQMAELLLPMGVLVLEVTGDDLEKWNVTSTQRLAVFWKKSVSRQRVVTISYALEHPDILMPWPLPGVQASSRAGFPGVWHLRVPVGVEAQLPSAQPLVASLSDWMRELPAVELASVFLAEEGTRVAVAEVRTIALSDAQVAAAHFRTELAMGGGMLTEARFEMVGNSQTGLILQIDPEARLLSCRVNDVLQAPVDLGEGRIRVMPAVNEERNLIVELTLSQQVAAFNPASGQVKLTMPSSPLLTKSALWTVRLPAELSLSAFDGSVSSGKPANQGEISFRQELYRESAPVVTLFYQKKIK